MIIIAVIFLIIFLYGCKLPDNKKNFHTDYMSIEKTTAIKGIFIILVFLCHFKSYANFTNQSDIIFYEYYSRINQRVVTLFMFYSGYGIALSIKNKGMSYIHKMPKKRILRVLVEFDIAIIVFTLSNVIYGYFSGTGTTLTIKKFLLSLVAWNSVGNSNWYIFAILVLYLFVFVAYEICKGRKYISAVCFTLMTVITVCAFIITGIKPPYWVNTMICFCAGVWFALLKDKIEMIVMKNNITYFGFTVAVFICTVVFSRYMKDSFIFTEFEMLSFTALIVLVTMKLSFNNRLLRFFGKNLLGIYVYQRLPMIYLKKAGLADWNVYVYFVACFLCTIILSLAFGKLIDLIYGSKKTPMKGLCK